MLIPEIGTQTAARIPAPVSCTSDMQFGAKFFWYQFSVTNTTVLYFCAGSWYRFSVRVFGADFWYLSLESVIECRSQVID